MRLPSSDGVEVAVHDFGGAHGHTLLISHATGFHAHCYRPMATALGRSARSVGFDYRGHGDTPHPPGMVDWRANADDCLAVARHLADQAGGPVTGFGHSMGGACLLLAAAREPALFDRIAVFEPIVPPPGAVAAADNPMAGAARRRRASFPTVEAALDNYASKPPLNRFRADALHAYVHHGVRPSPDGVTLKCTPEIEAATFEAAAGNGVSDILGTIGLPVVVLAGRLDGTPPPAFAEGVAAGLRAGRFVRLDEFDHFGPMTDPDRFAAVVAVELGW